MNTLSVAIIKISPGCCLVHTWRTRDHMAPLPLSSLTPCERRRRKRERGKGGRGRGGGKGSRLVHSLKYLMEIPGKASYSNPQLWTTHSNGFGSYQY
ncbi:hypothetical protein PoB_002673800 [Plakobranchus ocellatus]|uniref:Uncharacterized protein n=1 Tax=Plakobranchus ocellatus TaxID=259542 RepID=A0AAV3ZZC2_9GAST|nr:hypothetical protein PoB_002673800 [Plakobranchus ocellatus]